MSKKCTYYRSNIRNWRSNGACLCRRGRKSHPNRSPRGALRSLKEELQATYPNQKVWTFALDVTDMAMVKDVCQAILKSVGQVHVLVNNAGLALGLTAYQDYEE